MEKLIKKIIDERKVAIFLAVIIAFLGAYSYYMLPRQESPDVSAPIAMVITPYPGASPEDINDLVTSKIEDEISEIDGFDYVRSYSKDSVSIIIVYFKNEVEVDKVMQDLRNSMSDVAGELPDGAMASRVNTDLAETAGIIVSLSGDNYSYEQLSSFGEKFKKELTKIDGITKFNIEGEVEKEVQIKVNMQELNQHGISIEDVYKIVKIQNLEIPSGDIEKDGIKVKISTPGIYTSLKDIENVIVGVSEETGVVTRLRDVATVHIARQEDAEMFKQDSKNAVLLTGFFENNKNVVLVGKEVRTALDEIKATLPEDLIVEEIVYQPDDVSKSTNDFMMNLLEGIIFVVIVVFIGMGLRNAAVVSSAIPISILMTFGVMFMSGIKIHQMSLTALIIALGVLVDNAIVIADSIQVKLDSGIDIETAAIKSTSDSALPIFTATLTTVAAFSPLLGLPGAAGEFMKAIPLVLIISIVAAYIVSMTITPALSVFVLRKNENKKVKESKIRKSFERMLDRGLRHKKRTALGMLVVFILVMRFVLPSLETEFFPFVDKNVVYIDVNNEITGNIKSTEKLADDIEKRIKDIPEINSISTAIGNGMPKFYITMKPAIPSADYAQIVVKFDVKNGDHRFGNNEEFVAFLQDKLDNEVPNGTCIVNLLQNAEPLDARVLLRVSGENSQDINNAARAIEEEMKKIDGTTNIRDDIKDDIFKYNIDVDVDKASSMGVTKYDIQRQINIALYGANASVYRKDGNEYNIKVDSDVNSISDIKNMMIKSSLTENKTSVRQFAEIDLGTQTDTITKYQREKSVKILADVLPYYDSSAIESQIENEILPKLDLDGIDIDFDGEREQIKKYFSAVGVLAAFAVFLIYVILVVQFNSFLEPMVILITIPLSLIGSVLGLKLLNQPLSLTAFLGIIALIGLVVKNGILLIEFINDAKKQGHSVDDACKDAVDKRFNAIILSAATTVMGLVPLALSNSSLFAPMAVSLMSGLIVSTFLTMVIIPVIYSMIFSRVKKQS